MGGPQARQHAILVDIDDTPRHHLHPDHAGFYDPLGLCRLLSRLHPGGVFGLRSDGAPDHDFLIVLGEVFVAPQAHEVTSTNPYTGGGPQHRPHRATRAGVTGV